MRFRAVLGSNGRTATGFVVPEEVVAGTSAGRHPKAMAALRHGQRRP
ncbi:MAG: hypothetical protein ABI873_00995 [Marmoricola sp.]